jgi:hypothetical protein
MSDDNTPEQLPDGAKTVPTRAEIVAAEQANDAALAGLAQRYGVQFDGGAIFALKFDALVTALFGDLEAEARRVFDWAMVERFRSVVAETEAEVRKAVLQQGVQQPGLMVPAAGYRQRNGRPVRDNPQA